MTGIDRLRAIAGAWDEWGLGGTLAEMADQIERERAEDCYRMGLDCGTVWRVVADMEHHILGHEGMEDSPVARWARELRGALKSDASDERGAQNPSWHDPADAADVTSEAQKVTRDHAKFQKSRKVANSLTSHSDASDVSMSSYDLLPQEERDAIAWVRKHGGIDYVKREWRSRVPYDRYEARRQSLLGHIAECETALGRRNRRIEELEGRVKALTNENAELRRRAMPEGCEWPRYKDGELVQIVAMFAEKGTIKNVVASVELSDDWFAVHGFDGAIDKYSKGERVKRPSVLAADGEPLESEQTVWDANGDELVVVALEDGGNTVTCRYADVGDGIPTHGMWSPSQLTHTKPEPPDSWDALWDDIEDCDVGYESFMRRCRALAERERGE